MPVTVRGIHKYCLRGLPRTQTVTRTGTATADYVQSAATENVYLQNGLLQTSVRPGTVLGNVGTIAVDVDLSGTVLTDAQVAEIHEQIRIAFSEHIRQVQRDVMTSRVNRFIAPFVGRFEPESDALGAEGVSFGLAYAWLEVTTTRLTQGLDLRFAPTERPGGAAPAQGPIVREYLFSVVPPHGGQPATIGVREEAFNALFWSAWQAGSDISRGPRELCPWPGRSKATMR